jgi:predicted O-methyltransferase YrrM
VSTRSIGLDDRLYSYLVESSVRESPLLARLREETADMPMARMQVAPEQGQFLALLVELTGARSILEIGTFTGYSSLCMALAMPEDGHMLCCDSSEQWTAVARRYWAAAGVSHKIELRLAAAAQTLEELLAQGRAGQFDLAFLDADKENYGIYYERCLELLRPGGVLAVDNTLWSGAVADPQNTEATTEAIRALNLRVRDDERVSSALVPIGDGLSLIRKR